MADAPAHVRVASGQLAPNGWPTGSSSWPSGPRIGRRRSPPPSAPSTRRPCSARSTGWPRWRGPGWAGSRPVPSRERWIGYDPDGDPLGEGVLPLLALVVTTDDLASWHRGRGVPAEVSKRTRGELAQQLWVHRASFGTFGLRSYGWLPVTWCGSLYWLGRLQFNLLRLGKEWVCSTHIPRSGPLHPAAVDAALRQAAAFFPAYFRRLSGERLLVLRAGCSLPTWRPSCRPSRTSPTSSAAGGWTASTSRPTTTCCSSSSGGAETWTIESLAAEHDAATGGGRPAAVGRALE